jgi:hypothetical protein
MREEPEATEPGEGRGKAAANAVTGFFSPFVRTIAMFVTQLTYVVMRVLPFVGGAFWKRLAMVSLANYHKRAGGDAVALLGKEEANKADLKPVQYQDGLDELEDGPGWSVKGMDRKYKPSRHGGPFRLGKTPVVPIDITSTRAGSPLECEVVEAIDQGRTRPLYRVGDDAQLTATVDYSDAVGGSQALADGGAQMQAQFDPGQSPIFDDVIVDLSPGGEYDGQAYSMWKYMDADPDKTTPEQIEMAKNRGLIAGMAGRDYKSLLVKIMLIGGAVAVAGLIGPEIVSGLLGGGGGGGGGGSINPFSIALPSMGWF